MTMRTLSERLRDAADSGGMSVETHIARTDLYDAAERLEDHSRELRRQSRNALYFYGAMIVLGLLL
jgi:hypothetical protein